MTCSKLRPLDKLLFLGVGTIALALREALPDARAFGTTRNAPDARFAHITPITASDEVAIRAAARDAHVLVSFPPDGQSDARFSALVGDAASVAYLSSTGVYPLDAQTITEASHVAAVGPRALVRVAAERLWLTAGASVIRLPAFYGVGSGLHVSLREHRFRMPGVGRNIVSRVHVDDAARFVLAALSAPSGTVLLAGDDEPAPVCEVVAFVTQLFGLPMPPESHGEDIPLSLRGNRRIQNAATKTRFAIELRYPSYREGYGAIHANITR